MKKAGKQLFQRLGALRDVQVMMEWVEKLQKEQGSGRAEISNPKPTSTDMPDSATRREAMPGTADLWAAALLEVLRKREKDKRHEAHSALQDFDRKQWRQWAYSLPARAARTRPGSALFKHLALERWTEARQLHLRALRNRSQVAFHSLRIGIKRFRYIVENFLPLEHAAWTEGLKEIQDLLGEVHDLDVLWSTAAACRVFPDPQSRRQCQRIILAERKKRIDRYRLKMTGSDSLWQAWRVGLPQGKQVPALATRRIKLWARRLDPDFPHSEHVAGLALQLYDGLLSWGWQPSIDASSARSSLLAASLLHDVGKSKGQKGHHKASFELIRANGDPLGWNSTDLRRAAIVARFHSGVLPTRGHKSLRDLMPNEQKGTIQLSAILRLANALDSGHDGHIQRIQVENNHAARKRNQTENKNRFGSRRSRIPSNEPLIIAAEGYRRSGAAAQTIATERFLLETVLRSPVMVIPMNHPRSQSPRLNTRPTATAPPK